MKTDRPYIQIAYCPEPGCWRRWVIFSISGIDEDAPLKCPFCHKTTARLTLGGDYQGDQLRKIYEELDKAKEKKRAEREAAENGDEDEDDDEKK